MSADPATPVDAVTEAWPREQPGEIELACQENGHAWFGYVTGDHAHGVVGKCPCGSHLYAIDGSEIDS